MKISKIFDIATLGSGYLISSVIAGIFWFYLATIMQAEEYGEIGYLLSIAGVMSSIAIVGSHTTIVVYKAKNVDVVESLFVFVLGISSIVTIIVFLIFWELSISIYVIGFVIFGLATSEMLGRKNYSQYSKHLVLQKILAVALAILLYFLIGPKGVVLGYGISFLPYMIFLVKKVVTTKISFEKIKSNSSFIINNYIVDLLKVFSGNIDKIIIGPLFGLMILGNYYLAFQIIVMLGLIPALVFQYVLPRESAGQTNEKLQNYVLVFVSVIVVLVIILSPIVIPTIFPNYTDAITITQIMSVHVFAITIINRYNVKLIAREKSKFVSIASGIRIVVQIISLVVLGSYFGVEGLAMALVIASFSQVITLYFLKNQFLQKIN